jgi:hypothetical protein
VVNAGLSLAIKGVEELKVQGSNPRKVKNANITITNIINVGSRS